MQCEEPKGRIATIIDQQIAGACGGESGASTPCASGDVLGERKRGREEVDELQVSEGKILR